jgi:hypothetical protein
MLHQEALVALARNNGRPAFPVFTPSAFLGIEPEFRLPRVFVGSVTLETIVRQDRKDFAREANRLSSHLGRAVTGED